VRFVAPVAAAAAVIAIVVAATTAVHLLPGSTGTTGSASTGLPALGQGGPPPSSFRVLDRPKGAILTFKLALGATKETAQLWLGYANPAYWQNRLSVGPQFCEYIGNAVGGEDGCTPLPQLGPGHLAGVGFGNPGGAAPAVMAGVAARQVSSVTAVLPDGRTYQGTVSAGGGFAAKAWTVMYPAAARVRLEFRDAARQQVASLAATATAAPMLARPRSGGVTVFRYPASAGSAFSGSAVTAYLIDGRVAFWAQDWFFAAISPTPANGAPAFGGVMWPPDDYEPAAKPVVAVTGYAHADVARVVLRLRDGKQFPGKMIATSWRRSGLRLWSAALPESIYSPRSGTMAPVIAIAYAVGGQVLGEVQLASNMQLAKLVRQRQPTSEAPESGAVPVSGLIRARYPELLQLGRPDRSRRYRPVASLCSAGSESLRPDRMAGMPCGAVQRGPDRLHSPIVLVCLCPASSPRTRWRVGSGNVSARC
jgi:hypothetical protein